MGPVFEHALVDALGLPQIGPAIIRDTRIQNMMVAALDDVDRVDLHIAEMFDRCYDTGRYQYRAHYRDPVPPPPLRPELVPWMEQLFREKGIIEPAAPREGAAPAMQIWD